MTILGILQNQWFKDPVRAARIYESHGTNWDMVAKLNSRYLFYQSRTGRNLKSAFGEELCDKIIWWEASPLKAGVSSGAFPPDFEWIATAVRHFNPRIVITFGAVARKGLAGADTMVMLPVECEGYDEYHAPHPTARHATAQWELLAVANRVKKRLERYNG